MADLRAGILWFALIALGFATIAMLTARNDDVLVDAIPACAPKMVHPCVHARCGSRASRIA